MSNLLQKIIGNVTTRIMFIIYMSIIVISAFFIIFGYINQLNLHEEKEYEKLTALASSLSINIDGDAHEKMMLENQWIDGIKTIDENAEYYKIHKMLHHAQEDNQLEDVIYSLVYNEEENVFYYGVRSDTQVYFRHKYEMFPDILLEKMDEGGIIPRYRDEYGEWLSAFHPITNSEGKTVGLLETDINFSHFKDIVFNHYKTQALISIGVILLMALFLIPYARKILRQDEELKKELLEQKQLIEKKNRDINDSIHYARKIQEALLPEVKSISDALPKSFIYYRPKDIVSGDFYWFDEKDDKLLLAAVDCTGHGVPGALMSMIGHSRLNAIVSHIDTTNPGDILTRLDEGVTKALRLDLANKGSKDGMDISLCSIDIKNKQIQFAGAFRSLLKISNNEIIEIKGNRFPIGGGGSYIKGKFDTHEMNIVEGDAYFMYSDGFPDQFGGANLPAGKAGGKKFMNKRFKDLLKSIVSLSPEQQIEKLDEVLNEWKGDIEQVDDILVIGFFF